MLFFQDLIRPWLWILDKQSAESAAKEGNLQSGYSVIMTIFGGGGRAGWGREWLSANTPEGFRQLPAPRAPLPSLSGPSVPLTIYLPQGVETFTQIIILMNELTI